MGRLDPIIALSASQRLRLATADVNDPLGVLRVSRSLTIERFASAPMLGNARTVLAALDEGPVRATKELGNFERRFVARMLDELRLNPDSLTMYRRATGAPNRTCPSCTYCAWFWGWPVC